MRRPVPPSPTTHVFFLQQLERVKGSRGGSLGEIRRVLRIPERLRSDIGRPRVACCSFHNVALTRV